MVKEPPIVRIKTDDDEIGIYREDDSLRLIYYDQQGEGVFVFPTKMAEALGIQLIHLSERRW